MPRSYDLNPVKITHHPTQRLDTALGKLPPFDIQQIIDGFLTALKDLTGIDLTGIRDFLENMFGSIDWSNLPDAGDVWQFVVSTFIQPIIDIVGQIGDALNAVLGPVFGGIDFNDLPTPAEVWQTVINTLMLPLNLLLGPSSPLNALNIFGRLQLPQFGGGVPLSALTPTVPNELEPFSASSVPAADGWSYDAVADAAKVVCDGSTKTLYLSGAAIKVEAGQPLNIAQKVHYTGVTSGAGQTIQYVLNTFTSDDGSGTATPVVVDGITNPTGTASTVTIGDTSWDIPAGVGSVRPVLIVDDAVTAGTVFWENTPSLTKALDASLAGGLPAVLNNLGDWIESLVDQMLGALGLPALGTLFDKINDLSDEIGDWLTDTLGTQSDLANLIGDLLSNPASVLGALPQSLISGLTTSLANAGQGIRDAIVQALGGSGTGHSDADVLSALLNIPQSVVSGLTGTLGNLQTTLNQIGDIFDNTVVTPINSVVQAVKDWWNQWFGGSSTNAIPLSQKGAINGVAPLDSNRLIPDIYLPASSGGGGEPTEHILFTLSANQSIPSGTATALTGWVQVGSVEATFDDGTNTRWTLPKAGWWDIQAQVAWGSSTVGKRQSAIVRALSSGSTVPAIDGESADNFPSWGVRNSIRAVQEVAARAPLAALDKFSIQAYQNSGGALNAVAGYPDGTYVLAVYLGERESEFVGFYEENTNRTNQAVPAGSLGCWVTLIGGGGSGGSGQQASNAKGGAGGGGGATIFRSWIPIAALGTTYSVTRGLGGISGNGAASTFSSGSVSLSAGGGAKGSTGDVAAGSGGGAGGAVSVSGVTVTSAPGTAGGNVGTAAGSNPGVDNTAGGAAGGGSGAYRPGSLSGGDGGDTTSQTGDTGISSGRGGGGAGVRGNGSFAAGGDGGGGGAGSVGATSGGAAPGGSGGNGYTLIEWE